MLLKSKKKQQNNEVLDKIQTESLLSKVHDEIKQTNEKQQICFYVINGE